MEELIDKANAGDTEAQYELGIRYKNGEGVATNYGEARRYLEQAAVAGDDRAQSALGTMYAEGQGVAQDFQAAADWWAKAAEKYDAFSMSNLGVLYANGLSVAQDDVEAYAWFSLASAFDNAAADAYREQLQDRMSQAQISAGLKKMTEWMAAHKPS